MLASTSYSASSQPFTLGSDSTDNALPVELRYFAARQSDDHVNLTWQTDAEIQNWGFEVERSYAGGASELVKTFRTDPDLRAKSTWGSDYATVDRPEKDGQYTYNLYQVDLDGIRGQVASHTLYFGSAQPSQAALKLDVYPNPVSSEGHLQIQLAQPSDVSLRIYDATGRFVASGFEGNLMDGTHVLPINTSDLATGTYTVIATAGMQRTSKTFIVRR